MVRVDLAASGSIVEVATVPYGFHAPKFDSLDRLFNPLVSLAQLANDLMGLRMGNEEDAHRASAFLAGELLRDSRFVPTRAQMSACSTSYTVDLTKNLFQVETAVLGDRAGMASIFRLRITGAVRGDKFVVSDPTNGVTLFSFTRFEAEKANFFDRDFPFLAQESRNDNTLSTPRNQSWLNGVVDLVLGIPVNGKTVTVRVQKQPETLTLEVRRHPSNITLMSLPLNNLSNIAKLIDSIGSHLRKNPVP